MNIFPAVFSLIFWISLVYFIINPMGFIRESEQVLRAPGPMIVDGHMAFPQGKKTNRKNKKPPARVRFKELPSPY